MLIFVWTFGVIFLNFFMLVTGIITLIFRSSVNHTAVILKYLNINPTSSNNLTLRSTLLLCLNCCYKTAHTNIGTKVPGTKGLGYEKSVIRPHSLAWPCVPQSATGKMRMCGSANFLDLKMTKPNYKPNIDPKGDVQNGHKPKRPRPKWPQTKTAKNQTKTASVRKQNNNRTTASTLNYNVSALM